MRHIKLVILTFLLTATSLLVLPPPAVAASVAAPVTAPTPVAVAATQPDVMPRSTTVFLPNYHWNASSIGVGECTDNTCRAWVRLPAGQRTDSYLGWSHAYGVRYDALACFDFWDTPADDSHLGWYFAGRVTVSKSYPAVPLDQRYHWRYVIHTTIACP